jgi:magnesium chelatase accessory protein
MSLTWEREGLAWPHREASRFVRAAGLRWHVQQMGTGPVALLIHGTGASTHSWRGLMPLLARRFTVVAMDLPGHAFTDAASTPQPSLPGMAQAVAALATTLTPEVSVIVGHSAGAAIGARILLDGGLAATTLVAINGAFLPLSGLAGLMFPPVARLMAGSRIAPYLFARRRWDPAAVERLIAGTGSRLDDQGLALYGVLLRDPGHAAGALDMMARWDLRALARDLAHLRTPLAAIVGANDRAVPPRDAQRSLALLPSSTHRSLDQIDGAGHLVHEEQPAEVARLILAARVDAGAKPVR